MMYIKKIDDSVVEAPSSIIKNGYTIIGYNKESNEEMLLEDGYIAYSGYLPLANLDIVDGEIIETPIANTLQDYDNAMESKLKATRYARGYTVREPSAYLTSTNQRWEQDAQDWVAYVDAMMAYGLEMQNNYTSTGIIPSLEDFISGFPEIVWSYDNENTEQV